MQRVNSLLSAGVTLTSTGTAVASPIPLDSAGYFPQFVRVVATGAGCFVKVGDIGVTAVSGDCMIQPLDGTVLNVRGCKAISAISVSGTSSVTVVPLEAGSWNYDQRTLDYNFTTLSAVPSTVTFTRASNATYFNSSGVLTTASNNVARLDYDPVTLLPRGLLVEEQRTNNETNGVAPSKHTAGDTLTQNVIGPDGVSNSAWTVTGDGTSGAHSFYQASVTPTSGNTYTVSVFMKAGTQSFVQICTGLGHSGATVYCNYNLSTTSPAMTAGAGVVSGSNFQTYIGNGWYRCGFSYVASATVAAAAIVTCMINSMSDIRFPTTGISATYYRFGGQYESTTGMGSAPFVTSYIPTTTASATRSSDSASMTGTSFSSWYNQSAGTFVVEFSNTQTGSGRGIISVNDGTANNAFDIRPHSNASYGSSGGVSQWTIAAGVAASLQTKTALAYATNDVAVSTNGATVGTDSLATIPTVNQLSIGTLNATTSFIANAYIRRIQYYPTRLPNASLIALTS